MMKVLCINPGDTEEVYVKEGRCMEKASAWSNLRMPITLAYISSILKKNDFDVKIVDVPAYQQCGKSFKVEEFFSYKPNITIINTSYPTLETDIKYAKIAKEHGSITILFGIPATNLDKMLTEHEFIDYCIVGEPEITSLEICQNIRDHKKIDVQGISFNFGSYKRNKNRTSIINLDDLPFPDYKSLPLESYLTPFNRKKQVLINTSRGCSNGCKFCQVGSYYGKKVRHRSVKSVIQEIKYVKSLDVSDIVFWSDNFTYSNEFVKDLCKQILSEKLNINWIINSRIDTLNIPDLSLMKIAGCRLISFGVESFQQETLDYINKGLKVNQIRDTIREVKKSGIPVSINMILGANPNETKSKIRDNFKIVNQIKPNYITYHIAVPYPKTDLLEEYSEFIVDNNVKSLRTDTSIVNLTNINQKELIKLRREGFIRFYFHPYRIIKQIKKRNWIYLIKDSYIFFRYWVLS